MVQRALQQHAHFIAFAAVGQGQHLAEHTLAMEQLDLRLRIDLRAMQEADNAWAPIARVGGEQLTEMAVLHTEERHLQVAHGAQFMGELRVHGKAHDHACDRHRPEHIFLHQQIGAPGHGDDQHLLAAAPRLAQGIGIREQLAPRLHQQGTDHDPVIQAQHHHFAGTDPGAMGAQGLQDRHRPAAGHRLLERPIGGEPVQPVLQAPPAQVQQALEHLPPGVQLYVGLVLHRTGGGSVHGKIGGGHDHQQQQRQHSGYAGLKRVAPVHGRALGPRSSLLAVLSLCHTRPCRLLTGVKKTSFFMGNFIKAG